MRVYGPDGRVWTIGRRPNPPRAFAVLIPGTQWLVEAKAGDEVRRWRARSRRAAGQLVVDLALALRTGAEGPSGELPLDDPGTVQDA